MVTYTVLEFETEVIKEAKRLNLTESFNKKMKFTDCASVILLIDNDTMSKEQLTKLAIRNLNHIKNKFSFKGLRIYFYAITHNNIFDRHNDLQLKYDKLISDIEEYHQELIKDKFNTTLEYYIYQTAIKTAYDIEYGILNDINNSLYAILKTINDTNYNETIIATLVNEIQDMLYVCGDKYYRTKDLTNIDNLYALYEHLAEEMLDTDLVNINQLFYNDDGYGNQICETQPFEQDIKNFKRWE